MRVRATSIALYIVTLVNVVTFYAIFPADLFSGDVYVAVRRHGMLHRVLYGLGIWLFMSTIVIPSLLWIRAVLDARAARVKQTKETLFIDCALVASWIVVFWIYIIFKTPFLVLIAARLGF